MVGHFLCFSELILEAVDVLPPHFFYSFVISLFWMLEEKETVWFLVNFFFIYTV